MAGSSRLLTVNMQARAYSGGEKLKELPQEPGTYVLVLRNHIPGSVQVGRTGSMDTLVGYYLYVGSAFGPGGLRSRVSHHLKVSLKPHWHVDYLRRLTAPVLIWFQGSSSSQEHKWARIINDGDGIEVAAPRFGASDCRCKSHLFFSKISPSLKMFCSGAFADGLGEGVREWSLVNSKRTAASGRKQLKGFGRNAKTD